MTNLHWPNVWTPAGHQQSHSDTTFPVHTDRSQLDGFHVHITDKDVDIHQSRFRNTNVSCRSCWCVSHMNRFECSTDGLRASVLRDRNRCLHFPRTLSAARLSTADALRSNNVLLCCCWLCVFTLHVLSCFCSSHSFRLPSVQRQPE